MAGSHQKIDKSAHEPQTTFFSFLTMNIKEETKQEK